MIIRSHRSLLFTVGGSARMRTRARPIRHPPDLFRRKSGMNMDRGEYAPDAPPLPHFHYDGPAPQPPPQPDNIFDDVHFPRLMSS